MGETVELMTAADAAVRQQYGEPDIRALLELARAEWVGLEPASSPEAYEQTRKALAQLRGTRGKIENRRTDLKHEHLVQGRRIDSVAKHLTEMVRAIEEPLAKKKKAGDGGEARRKVEAETAARRGKEAEERAAREKAEAEARAQREAEEAKRRAELEVEEARQAEVKRQQEAEQARLAEERAKLAAETARLKAEQDAIEAEKKRLAKIENDRAMAEAKAARDKERAEAKAKAEQEAKERAERQAAEAEAAAKAEADRLEAMKPDAEKLAALADKLQDVATGCFRPVAHLLTTREGALVLTLATGEVANAIERLRRFVTDETFSVV